jgi:hypothetical protein
MRNNGAHNVSTTPHHTISYNKPHGDPLTRERASETMISSGFTNAPVSRALVFGTVLAALLASLTDTRYYLPILVDRHFWGYGQAWRVLTWGWVFTNSTEVLFGVLGFYQLRVLERVWGTRKFLVSSGRFACGGGLVANIYV